MYNRLISLENIFLDWKEFKRGKQNRKDVQVFERFLEDNIFSLHRELRNKTYKHSAYKNFYINDPKPRKISKAIVKDRLIHHLVFRELYKVFEQSFIFHSYSSRIGKGTHLAVENFAKNLRKESRNYTRTVYILKCNIKKFFASISHKKLLQLIECKVSDKDFLWLISEIINSFKCPVDNLLQKEFSRKFSKKNGLPLGSVTSQIFANIYLNELDWFIKRSLGIKNYFRYADDFVIVHSNREHLLQFLKQIENFLKTELKLNLHPDKVFVSKFHQGVDFLGYVVFPYHKTLRTKTKRRMFRKLSKKYDDLQRGKIKKESFEQSLQSYLGVLKHCEGRKIEKKIKKLF